MNKDEALRLALEALEFDSFYGTGKKEAITAIKAALEAKDEPVAYPEGDVVGPCICGSWPGGKCLKCPRITPPQRKPLTDEQAMDAYFETPPFGTYKEAFIAGIRFIEAAHGIKEEA